MAKKKLKKAKPRKPVKKTTKPVHAAKAVIEINHDWCKGCYICVESCSQGVLAKSDKLNERGFFPLIVTKSGSCTKCLECEMLCPDLAITVE